MDAICTVIGSHAPNTRMKSTSCYLISHKRKLLILDVGQFVKAKIVKYICSTKQEIDDITIVISHNHLDHVAGLISLGDFLIKYFPNVFVKIYMSDTSEIYVNWYKMIKSKYSNVFDIKILDENTIFKFSKYNVSFAKTNHCSDKLKSYATKISDGYNTFVYTSDIASIDDNIKEFLKDADVVMLDAGNPVERRKTLKGYHGKTNEIVSSVLKCNVKSVFLTHLKACFSDIDYLNSLNEEDKRSVYIVHEEDVFNIFSYIKKGENIQIQSSKILAVI